MTKKVTEIAFLSTPKDDFGEAESIGKLLDVLQQWQHSPGINLRDELPPDLWYRGVNTWYDFQVPGVYRKDFTAKARKLTVGGDETLPDIAEGSVATTELIEARRLHLERVMLGEFRTRGAAELRDFDTCEMYLTAQHYGMSTRLLDWSTNPLAALFFACDGANDNDGFIYAMDARKVIPEEAQWGWGEDEKTLHQSVMSVRHPMFVKGVGLSFWDKPRYKEPYILPVRPDAAHGRISQQSSCFTFHMHEAEPRANPTLQTIRIPSKAKSLLLTQLRALNINRFTIYPDLDNLSKELKGFFFSVR